MLVGAQKLRGIVDQSKIEIDEILKRRRSAEEAAEAERLRLEAEAEAEVEVEVVEEPVKPKKKVTKKAAAPEEESSEEPVKPKKKVTKKKVAVATD